MLVAKNSATIFGCCMLLLQPRKTYQVKSLAEISEHADDIHNLQSLPLLDQPGNLAIKAVDRICKFLMEYYTLSKTRSRVQIVQFYNFV